MNFIDALDEQLNTSVTENGAKGYKTTKKPLLDMNFKVTSYRNYTDEGIIRDFMKAYEEDKIHALKWLFYCRDIRQGLGERRFFRVVIKFLSIVDSEVIKKLLPLFAEYGRWDDLFCVSDSLFYEVAKLCGQTLSSDLTCMYAEGPISLLAKWMPSENASSKKTRALAIKFRKAFGMTPKYYRQMLSKLRKYIDITERKMSSNDWQAIDYNRVPSRANLIYNNAFLKHDKERREAFFEQVKTGEAKINASVLYPHEIVHKYEEDGSYDYWQKQYTYNTELELLWKNLPEISTELGSTIVVADGSGSMNITTGNVKTTALQVANALAIYCAERCSSEYKNKYITFSTHPQFVDFTEKKTLCEKLTLARQYNEVSDTNIEAVFDLILETAITHNLSQEDLPKNIIILSDMEFNEAEDRNHRLNSKLFDIIKDRYKEAGYQIPRLVFWNLNSRTNTIPVKENDLGVTLVSGFSINILNMVMSNKLDPYEALLDIIDSPRYQAIEDCIK